ncbi:MAG TPA: hypothetical protein VNK43_07940 [Gemmatimonadales bacterium]|nr:hypothetical protein [Gemmatimonadales bacterium]
MKLTLTREMLDALDQAVDKPDWLVARLAQLRAGPEPYLLSLNNQEMVALEELCAMNIRFDADGQVKPQHKPLDELSLMLMEQY